MRAPPPYEVCISLFESDLSGFLLFLKADEKRGMDVWLLSSFSLAS